MSRVIPDKHVHRNHVFRSAIKGIQRDTYPQACPGRARLTPESWDIAALFNKDPRGIVLHTRLNV